MSLASRIQERRLQLNLSRDELAEMIGVSTSAIGNYENGYSTPKIEYIFKLIKALKCDANYLYQDEMKEIGTLSTILSGDEANLISTYRTLDEHGKYLVGVVSLAEADRCKKQKSTTSFRVYTYYRRIACAGEGFIFDDIPSETIEAEELEGADFVIGVNGDSMEPEYHDGDDVYVKRTKDLQIGDVGIFTINNECFIKVVGKDGLESLNPEYPDIPGSPDIHPIGRVLGKVEK